MKIIRDLRRFVLIASAEGTHAHAEIRAYITDRLDELARALRVEVPSLAETVELTGDDRLAGRLLDMTVRAEALHRAYRRNIRLLDAQAAADQLSRAIEWKGDAAHLDLPKLLSCALTRRQDSIVFTCDDFTVSLDMSALLDLSRIARVRMDLSGFVDRHGLHLRWKSGALNLISQPEPSKRKIVHVTVNLPARTSVAA